jgi:hypothetical protein
VRGFVRPCLSAFPPFSRAFPKLNVQGTWNIRTLELLLHWELILFLLVVLEQLLMGLRDLLLDDEYA